MSVAWPDPPATRLGAERISRVALVTGGGRGIGRAISLALGDGGCDVAVNYRADRDAAEKTVAQLSRLGRRAVAVQASVDDWSACQGMVDEVGERLGPPGIVVHNGGIISSLKRVVDTEPREVEELFRVHALGGFHLAKAAMPSLLAQERGDVVMLSSLATEVLRPRHAPYSMAKAALEALAMTLAKELAGTGVRVNVVAPGLVATDMGDLVVERWSDGRLRRVSELDDNAPFGRACRPEDVAQVVQFLVSDAARYVNAVRIKVDGGGGSSLALVT